jgi:hypothetical protein
MKFLLIIIFISINNLLGGVLKGVVLNKHSKQPLEYINVILLGSNLETVTDSVGHFIINNIPDGTYILSIPTMLHEKYERSITFNPSHSIYDLEIPLEKVVPFIPKDSVIEEYHSKLNLLPQSEILKIDIDSVVIRGNLTNVFSTFSNLSDFPIYVLRTSDCIFSCKIDLYKDGKKITSNFLTITDCLGMKTHPDSSDFLEILPHDKINYPPVQLLFSIPNEALNYYELTLTYNYKRPEFISGPTFIAGAESFYKSYKNVFYYYNMAFRGNVRSENIKFAN